MTRYYNEIRKLIKLAFPVLLSSLSQTAMSFVDTIMAGSISATDMASVSLASSIWLPTILFGVGILSVLIPVVSQLNGSYNKKRIPFVVQHGVILALLISIPIVLLLYNSGLLIKHMHLEENLSTKTIGYLNMVIFSVPAFLLFQVFKNLSDGISLTVPSMVIGFLGLLINIPLNWIFVYGRFGMPELGAAGCGVATSIVYWIMFIVMLSYILFHPTLKKIDNFNIIYKPQAYELIRLFKMGLPIACSIFFEVSLFSVIALFISPLGSTIVASHQVALNFSSLVYMLPMSLGSALSIRVSFMLGQNDIEGTKIICHCGFITSILMAITTASLTLMFREEIIQLYSDNRDVLFLASKLLILAAIYQCIDAIQVIAAGCIRGYKNMNAIFIRTFISYWVIGLPIGYFLGMTNFIIPAMGPRGFWIGSIIGLTSSAIMLGKHLIWIHGLSKEQQLAMSNR